MAGTPNRTLAEFFRGNIDLTADTLRIALYDNSTAYTFDPDTHEFVNDILDGGTTAQELAGSSGYTGSTDRQTLAGVSVTSDNTDDEGVFDANDVTWSGVSSTEDIQGWIVYKQVGGDDNSPGDDPVLLVVDDGMADAPASLPLATNGSDINVVWNSEGVFDLSVA
jgi:hypothetical protein